MFAYYRALALRGLDQESAASQVLRDLRQHAIERQKRK